MFLSVDAKSAPLSIVQDLTNIVPIKISEEALKNDKQVLDRARVSHDRLLLKNGVELWDQYRFDARVLGLIGIINDPTLLDPWRKLPLKRDNQIDKRVRRRSLKTWEKMRQKYKADIFPSMVVNTRLSRLKYYHELISWFATEVQPLQSIIDIGSAADQVLLSISENSSQKPAQLIGIDKLSVKQALRHSTLSEIFRAPGWENLTHDDYIARLEKCSITHYACDVREIDRLRGIVPEVHPRLMIFSHILEYFNTDLIQQTLEKNIEIFKPEYLNIFTGLYNHGFRNPLKPDSKTINLLYKIKY